MESVVKAIDALGRDNGDADRFLTTFERSTEAWEVCYGLLVSSTNPTYRFFAAKMLYSKAQRDYIQLDSAGASQLKASLLQQLVAQGKDSNVPMNICRYMCLAISALAIQGLESNVVSEILQHLNELVQVRPLIILEKLCVLSEECGDRKLRITSDQRDDFRRQLTQSVPEVFGFLDTLLLHQAQGPRDTIPKIMTCLSLWIENTDVPGDFLLAAPVFTKAMGCFNRPELVCEACEVVVQAVLQVRRSARDNPNAVNLMLSLSQHVLSLRQHWRVILGSQAEVVPRNWDDAHTNACRALAQVFCDTLRAFADAYIDGRIPGIQDILDQLLECARFSADFTVARVALDGFYELTLIMKYNSADEEEDFHDRGSSNRDDFTTMTAFQPYFRLLLEICLAHSRLDDDELQSWDELDENRARQRMECKDSVGSCCEILGAVQCLQLIHGVVLGDQSPSTIEACLFVLEKISTFLSPHEDRTNQCLTAFVEALSTLPAVPKLTLASVRFVGDISFWIGKRRPYVERFVPMLLNALGDPHMSSCAANSLRLTCEASSVENGLPITSISDTLVDLRYRGIIDCEADLQLLEGLSIAVSKIRPYDTSAQLLRSIFNHIGAHLTPEIINTMSMVDLHDTVDRMITIVDFYDVPVSAFHGGAQTHPVLLIYDASWTFLQYMLSVRADDSLMHERASRFYKHVIRRVGAFSFAPRLPNMLTHVVNQYSSTKCSTYLYLASVCIKDFAVIGNGQFVEALCNMLSQISVTFFTIFPSLDSIQTGPDAVEEYLCLMGMALAAFPSKIVHSTEMMVKVIEYAISALDVPDQSVQRATVSFFVNLVACSTSRREDSDTCNVSRGFLDGIRAALVRSVILNVAGKLPPFAVYIDRGHGSAAGLLWDLKLGVGEADFMDSVEAAAQALPTHCIKYADVLAKARGARGENDIRLILRDFERCCRIW